jgi:hypothetical protein
VVGAIDAPGAARLQNRVNAVVIGGQHRHVCRDSTRITTRSAARMNEAALHTTNARTTELPRDAEWRTAIRAGIEGREGH